MLRGSLSNEDNFLREVSLCREIFTVMWRYWITLFSGLVAVVGLSVNLSNFFALFSFLFLEIGGTNWEG